MIIGNGLIATGFKKFNHSNIVILASGVSNSLETDIFQFNKEREVILKAIAKYPNRKSMYKMIMDPEYQKIHIHRDAGLEGRLNIETINKSNGKDLGIFSKRMDKNNEAQII